MLGIVYGPLEMMALYEDIETSYAIGIDSSVFWVSFLDLIFDVHSP